MPLLLWLLWTAVLLALAKLCYGRRNWFSDVVADVHPGRPEPTPRGYRTLLARDLGVVALLLAFAVPTTVERVVVTQDELHDATVTAVGLVPEGSLSTDRVRAQLTVLLDREVRVDDLSEEYAEQDDDGTVQYFYWEVRVGDPTEDLADVEDDTYVCIDGQRSSTLDGPATESATVNSIGCRD